jgi:hypothetical protein
MTACCCSPSSRTQADARANVTHALAHASTSVHLHPISARHVERRSTAELVRVDAQLIPAASNTSTATRCTRTTSVRDGHTFATRDVCRACTRLTRLPYVCASLAAELLASDPSLQSFASALSQLEQLVRDSSATLDSEEAALTNIRNDVLPALRDLRAELEEQHEQAAQEVANRASEQHTAIEERQPLANKTTSSNIKGAEPPRSAKKKGSTKDKESSSSSHPSGSHKKTQLTVDGIRMEHVTEAEFDTIPK